MEQLQRREGWQQDQPISDDEFEILTCISCPDSGGFRLSEDGISVNKPVCKWFNVRDVWLFNFPLIPFWCPRLEELEPDMMISAANPEKFYQKKQAFQNLSREAKQVLNVLFNLPEEFLSRNKTIIKSLISRTVRVHSPGHQCADFVEKIFSELKRFTWELIH